MLYSLWIMCIVVSCLHGIIPKYCQVLYWMGKKLFTIIVLHLWIFELLLFYVASLETSCIVNFKTRILRNVLSQFMIVHWTVSCAHRVHYSVQNWSNITLEMLLTSFIKKVYSNLLLYHKAYAKKIGILKLWSLNFSSRLLALRKIFHLLSWQIIYKHR